MSYDPLSLPVETVGRDDREQAEAELRRQLTAGAISHAEFDQRLGQVFLAEAPLDLAIAVQGPLPQPAAPLAGPVLVDPYRTHLSGSAPAPRDGSTVAAALAHFSVFVLWLFGPAAFWALSPRGSYARREAAKAFNFQLIFLVASVLIGAVAHLVLGGAGDMVSRVVTVLWVGLTVMGGVQAARGKDWINPVRRSVPWEVLNEQRR